MKYLEYQNIPILNRPFVAQGHKWPVASSIPIWRNYLFNIFISLPCGVFEVKRGFELRHLTRNASGIQHKVGNGSILMRTDRLNIRFCIWFWLFYQVLLERLWNHTTKLLVLAYASLHTKIECFAPIDLKYIKNIF